MPSPCRIAIGGDERFGGLAGGPAARGNDMRAVLRMYQGRDKAELAAHRFGHGHRVRRGVFGAATGSSISLLSGNVSHSAVTNPSRALAERLGELSQ